MRFLSGIFNKNKKEKAKDLTTQEGLMQFLSKKENLKVAKSFETSPIVKVPEKVEESKIIEKKEEIVAPEEKIDTVQEKENEIHRTYLYPPKEKETNEIEKSDLEQQIADAKKRINSSIDKNVENIKKELSIKDSENKEIIPNKNTFSNLTPNEVIKEGVKVQEKQEEKENLKKEKEIADKKLEEENKKEENKIIEFHDKMAEERGKYAEEYKNFMKKRSTFAKIKGKIFGSKIKKEKLPKELLDLEKNYDKATVEYGQKLYDQKKSKLLKEKLGEETLKKELEIFKQTELFQKIIVEEAEKLIALKAENLPPKEKNLFKKTLNWYIKQNRFTKVAMSVALTSIIVSTFSSGTVLAAGGLTVYSGTKYIRGLVGGSVGQMFVQLYDKIIKDKTGEKKETEKKELAKKLNIEENLSLEKLVSQKKEYSNILETEQKRKRNRTIHKAMVAVGFGGLASYGTSFGLNSLNTGGEALVGHGISEPTTPDHPTQTTIPNDTVNHNNIGTEQTPTMPEQISFKPVQIEISSRGAIQTIADLKEKINQDYPDISKAPTNIQEFMKTDNTQEAIKLGFYNPDSPNESAMGLKGSTLGFDENGKLISHDIKTGQDSILINEKGNIEKYSGPMADTHQNATSTQNQNNNFAPKQQVNPETGETTIENANKAPIQVSPETGQTIPSGQTPENVIPTENNLKTETSQVQTETAKTIPVDKSGDTTTLADNKTSNINQEQTINNQEATVQENIPAENNIYHLTQEQLTEVNKTYDDNIDKMFPENEQPWDAIKTSTENWSAEKLILWDENTVSEIYKPLITHLHKLEEITGLKPYGESLLSPIPETPEEFIKRTMEKCISDPNIGLDKVKL